MLSLSLLVIAGALVAANGVFYFKGRVSKKQNRNAVIVADNNTTIYTKDPTFKSFSNPYIYLDRKTNMMHKKLQRMEQQLVGINLNGNGNGYVKLNTDVYRKIERLEDFKRDTEIEIRAIKDMLEESGQLQLAKSAKQVVLDKSVEDKIRALAFNSEKRK